MNGNRCNHDPENLKLFKPEKNRPQFINLVLDRVRRWAHAPDRFLMGMSTVRRSKKMRRRRSEGREAQGNVLLYIIANTDFLTMAFGRPDDNTGKFIRYGYKAIAKGTGMSESRVIRALSELNMLGYLSTFRKCKRVGTQLVHDTAFRLLSNRLFEELGLVDGLTAFKDSREKRQQAKSAGKQQRINDRYLNREMKRQTRPSPVVNGVANFAALLH